MPGRLRVGATPDLIIMFIMAEVNTGETWRSRRPIKSKRSKTSLSGKPQPLMMQACDWLIYKSKRSKRSLSGRRQSFMKQKKSHSLDDL